MGEGRVCGGAAEGAEGASDGCEDGARPWGGSEVWADVVEVAVGGLGSTGRLRVRACGGAWAGRRNAWAAALLEAREVDSFAPWGSLRRSLRRRSSRARRVQRRAAEVPRGVVARDGGVALRRRLGGVAGAQAPPYGAFIPLAAALARPACEAKAASRSNAVLSHRRARAVTLQTLSPSASELRSELAKGGERMKTPLCEAS